MLNEKIPYSKGYMYMTFPFMTFWFQKEKLQEQKTNQWLSGGRGERKI